MLFFIFLWSFPYRNSSLCILQVNGISANYLISYKVMSLWFITFVGLSFYSIWSYWTTCVTVEAIWNSNSTPPTKTHANIRFDSWTCCWKYTNFICSCNIYSDFTSYCSVFIWNSRTLQNVCRFFYLFLFTYLPVVC